MVSSTLDSQSSESELIPVCHRSTAVLKIHQILEAYAKILIWLWHCSKSSVNQRNIATNHVCLVCFVGELAGRG